MTALSVCVTSGRPRALRMFATLVLVTSGIVTVVSCRDSNRSASAGDARIDSAAPSPARIRLATSRNLWCGLTLIALERGYFAAEGLSVEPFFQAAGRLNMDAMLSGSADLANVVETNLAYQSLSGTTDLMVLGQIIAAADYALITKRTSSVTKVAHLRGRSIAYAQATGAEAFLFWLLEHEGLAASDVTLVPVQPAAVVDNFVAGGTTAVATWEPFSSTIIQRISTPGPVFRSDSSGFVGIMTVASRRGWAREHPVEVAKYGRAMVRAATFARDSSVLAKVLLSRATGIPPAVVESTWPRLDLQWKEPTVAMGALVNSVVRRIRTNVPAMRDRPPLDASRYFDRQQS